MKRLLVLAPAPSISASTRFRLELFFPALHAVGIEPVLRPFLDEAGFRALYRRGQPIAKIHAACAALAGRVRDLWSATSADAVLVHREAALVGPPLWELAVSHGLRRPLLFDFDDALWVPYDSPTYGRRLSRLLKWPEKIDTIVRGASLVMAGNEYLAEWAAHRNDHVEIFPTVVDTRVFTPIRAMHDRPVLGWIGTHSTLPYLASIVPALQQLATRRAFVLKVVGATLDVPGIDIDNRSWRLDSEVADFQSQDIGLYPLVEDAWSLGKSGFKAVQYMACGVPVVASPVGVTTRMVRHGKTGYLATTHHEWAQHLENLLDDVEARRSLGAEGRRDAVALWSLEAHAARWVASIQRVLG